MYSVVAAVIDNQKQDKFGCCTRADPQLFDRKERFERDVWAKSAVCRSKSDPLSKKRSVKKVREEPLFHD